MLLRKVNSNLYQEDPLIWWDQLNGGERKGLESIYSAYVEDMYRYGMAIKANSSFVKDCIQEVFISLWKYKSSLNDTDNIKLYLFKCLGNKIHREAAADLSRHRTDFVDKFDCLHLILKENFFIFSPYIPENEIIWIYPNGR